MTLETEDTPARAAALESSLITAMAEIDSLKVQLAELRQARDARLTVARLPADDTEGGSRD